MPKCLKLDSGPGMDKVSAEKFLMDQFPPKYRSTIPTALKGAYAAANLMIKADPILQVKSAEDNRGRIIQWAVDLAVEKLLKTQAWPFDYRWKSFAHPTGHYLEIRLSHSVMSVSQIATPYKQPRNVVFRENARLNNEPFFDLDEFRDEREVRGLPHFLLTHGYQDLSFAYVAVPHSLHRRNYIYQTPNLMKMPHLVPSEEPAVEETEFEAAMELKQEIEKWRREHGE